MSLAYCEYLDQHISCVDKGIRWFLENRPDILRDFGLSVEDVRICIHDQSKFSVEEFAPYDKYFYGKEKTPEVKENFNYAWLHHIHHNPHHWQYWVLIHDEPNEQTEALAMPSIYILEMVCDWWAFSWAKGDLTEILKWYDEHKDHMILHTETRKKIDILLGAIREYTDELEVEE